VRDEVLQDAKPRKVELVTLPATEAIAIMNRGGKASNAILRVTCSASPSHSRTLSGTGRLPTVEMPKPVDPERAAHERALQEVGETMLMIEAAVTRVDRALMAVQRESAPDRQALVGLTKAKRDLEGVRRRLHQDVYLYVDALPFE